MPLLATLFALGSLWTAESALPAEFPDSLIFPEIVAVEGKVLRTPDFSVASGHPLASDAGARILARGGTAADAALAVQAMLALVEPEGSGPGGGCFILYYEAATGKVTAIDGREELPAAARPDMFLDENGQPLDDIFSGGLPVGVPGTIAAMDDLHRRFGRLRKGELFDDSYELANKGFPVGPDLALELEQQADRLRRFPSTRKIYFHKDGSPYALGDTLRNPDYAKFVRMWGGHIQFYHALAPELEKAVSKAAFRPGYLTADDVRGYRALEREVIYGDYRGWRLAVMPPPTSGGITLLEILGILETRAPVEDDVFEDDGALVDYLDGIARASRVAFADRGAYLGDPDWSPDIHMQGLLDPDFIIERARVAFDPEADLTVEESQGKLGGHTTHFSIVDSDGNVVSCTTTIEQLFGSGMVLPHFGFLLNNQLSDFNWMPSDPPAPNDVDPERRMVKKAARTPRQPAGKRPRSSMCPVIMFDPEGRPLALGSPGGSRIIGTVAGVVTALVDLDLSLEEAVAFPRIHCRNSPVDLESRGWNRAALAESLSARGWPVYPPSRWPLYQGDVNAIRVLNFNVKEGVSDPRRDGAPAGG
ncbi:gamma-glutamyltransferase [bacterium]|nr:gamma-glutamyltransferase [bacterium]